jgi:hypothetical protein
LTVRVRKNESSAAMYCSRLVAGQERMAAAFEAGWRAAAGCCASAAATAPSRAAASMRDLP